MCSVTKEAYAIVLVTDTFKKNKKTDKTHKLLEIIEYE